ncbi:hypothetical protein HDU76_002972 [Blyttiomyces sp. JEL0837]|nr:hypothetical protein HDU76_002972 [Blyttiomyces sp. JEL0837]
MISATVAYWKRAIVPALIFLESLRYLYMVTLVQDTSIGLLPPVLFCLDKLDHRTIDGTCNDLLLPWAGSKYFRFGRAQPLLEIKVDRNAGINGGTPNPRLVATSLLPRVNGTKFAPQQNLIAAAWIQFQIHDWFSHGDNDPFQTINIPLPKTDPLYKPGKPNVMKIAKTMADPHAPGIPFLRQNVMTHWWDLSQVYSSEPSKLATLRSNVHGKLTMDKDNLIPLVKNIERTGETLNWWAYPKWPDEQIFRKARLINAAISAKIHTIEWTPALLAEKVLTAGMYTNWFGSALLKVPALLGNPPPPVPLPAYAFPEDIPIQPIGASTPQAKIPLMNVTFGGSGIVRKKYSVQDLLHSFGTNLMGSLTLNNYPTALTKLIVPNQALPLDISTIDIVRDRERAVPRYNAYRRLMLLPAKKSISHISSDPAVVAAMNEVYGGDVEKVDLLIGSLAEDDRPDGFAFSETTFPQDFRPSIYTPEGIDIITKANMSTILATNFPELAPSLKFVSNPFLIWDDATIQSGYASILQSIQNELGLLAAQFPTPNKRRWDRDPSFDEL